MLGLRSFGAAFGDQTVLSKVTLELPRHGMTTLVGPPGSGKSTLLRTLSGINDAHPAFRTWGDAQLDGRPIQFEIADHPGQLRRGVGFVMQHGRPFTASIGESLIDNLPDRARFDLATRGRAVSEHLRRNGLGALIERLDAQVTSLSAGLQRRLAIARAVVSDPLLLLADEPTAGLSIDDAADVLALLRMHAEQRAVLLATHDPRLGLAAGGTTALLAGGRVAQV